MSWKPHVIQLLMTYFAREATLLQTGQLTWSPDVPNRTISRKRKNN